MIIYLPTFSSHKEVAAIDTEKARIEKWQSDIVAIFRGTVYTADHGYSDERGAWAYWNRDYNTMQKYELNMEEQINR